MLPEKGDVIRANEILPESGHAELTFKTFIICEFAGAAENNCIFSMLLL